MGLFSADAHTEVTISHAYFRVPCRSDFFPSRSPLRPSDFRSYLSKYLILHMLNYHPIQEEHHIFRGAGTGSTGQKVAIPKPLLGTPSQGNDEVTERAGITEHNCRRFSALTEVIEPDGMDMQLHVL